MWGISTPRLSEMTRARLSKTHDSFCNVGKYTKVNIFRGKSSLQITTYTAKQLGILKGRLNVFALWYNF